MDKSGCMEKQQHQTDVYETYVCVINTRFHIFLET